MTETKGIGRYKAISMSLAKSKGATDNIAYRFVYTLSSYKTDTEGINVRANDDNNYNLEYGYGDNNRTHVLSGLVTWYVKSN
ncbi:hypothetical protein ABTM17_19135, partial [Acinetobacter baumannii]